MRVCSIAPVSPYAMMAALTDDPVHAVESKLLVELVRASAPEEALISAALLAAQPVVLNSFGSDPYDWGTFTAQHVAGYLFSGVSRDPDFCAELVEQISALHPAVRPQSPAEICVSRIYGQAVAEWLSRSAVNVRIHAAYTAVVQLGVRRAIHSVLSGWLSDALAASREYGDETDFRPSSQQGYRQLCYELGKLVIESLEIEERRAMVLEKDGTLPRR